MRISFFSKQRINTNGVKANPNIEAPSLKNRLLELEPEREREGFGFCGSSSNSSIDFCVLIWWMDSKVIESVDSKAEFRKPLNDSANRKYRRRSSLSGSSSSSDVRQRDCSSSPAPSKKDTAKVTEDKRKRDDGRALDRDYSRSQSYRSGELYKHSDQQSSRSYHRHDDHHRRDKHADDYDRGHSKSSYRSVRDSQDHHILHSSRRERDHHGSRDYPNDMDIYSRKKSDGSWHRSRDNDSSDRAGSGRRHANSEDRNKFKDRDRQGDGRDYEVSKTYLRRSSGDNKSNHSSIYNEPKGQQNDSSSRRDNSRHNWKEATQRDVKGLNSETTSEEKRGHDNQDSFKEQCYGKPVEHTISDGTKAFSSNDQDSIAKKPKLFSHDILVSGADGTSEQSYVTDSDIDAAKIAAMRAAELVNKNLVGTGYMSADQKKKLLWGNKNTKIEESGHRWDTANFGDRERQEKFNKLMGVKGDATVGNQPDNPDVEKQQEQLQVELERQYTAGLRRRDGRTVGLGL